MKKALLAFLAIALAYAATAAPAFAQVLYTSGSSTYNLNGYAIQSPLYVTDSFDPTQSGTATSVEFVAWLYLGDSLTDVSWSIGTTADSSNLGSGTVDPSASFIQANSFGYNVYSETFSIPNLSLTDGDTYYLTLQNAVSSNTDPVFWDENDNSNTGYQGGGGTANGAVGSETFEILGTPNTVAATPEPSSLLLLGTGLLGLGLVARARPSLRAGILGSRVG